MKLSAIAKRMILVTVFCFFIIVAIGALLAVLNVAEFWPLAFGAVFGTAISLLKIIMIERTVAKASCMSAEKVGNYVRMQHLFRFAITGVLFIAAAIIPIINIYSAAAGILSFQAAAVSSRRAAVMHEGERN